MLVLVLVSPPASPPVETGFTASRLPSQASPEDAKPEARRAWPFPGQSELGTDRRQEVQHSCQHGCQHSLNHVLKAFCLEFGTLQVWWIRRLFFGGFVVLHRILQRAL